MLPLINCLFANNYADADGGALRIQGAGTGATATLTNCTIADNTADLDGGGISKDSSSTVTITNCILWGNSPDQMDGSVTVTYSCVQGGGTSNGNINQDPGFAGNGTDPYKLTDCSPCIDAGNNDALPADVADLDLDADLTEAVPEDILGAVRKKDDEGKLDSGAPNNDAPYVDMGAYEYQDTSACE